MIYLTDSIAHGLSFLAIKYHNTLEVRTYFFPKKIWDVTLSADIQVFKLDAKSLK